MLVSNSNNGLSSCQQRARGELRSCLTRQLWELRVELTQASNPASLGKIDSTHNSASALPDHSDHSDRPISTGVTVRHVRVPFSPPNDYGDEIGERLYVLIFRLLCFNLRAETPNISGLWYATKSGASSASSLTSCTRGRDYKMRYAFRHFRV